MASGTARPSRKRPSYYREPSKTLLAECEAAGLHVDQRVLDAKVSAVVERLALPDDWRERLEELVEDRPEREDLDAKRRYIQGRLRRLREVYVDGDLGRTEYARRRDELRAQLVALEEPEPSEVEHAAETLETRGTEWAGASKRLRRAMLRVIFEGIYCDMIERRVVYVRPYPAFVPLFRMDGMEQREDGNFYPKEDGQQA